MNWEAVGSIVVVICVLTALAHAIVYWTDPRNQSRCVDRLGGLRHRLLVWWFGRRLRRERLRALAEAMLEPDPIMMNLPFTPHPSGKNYTYNQETPLP